MKAFSSYNIPSSLSCFTLPHSIIKRGKHERPEVQRIINYFIIYCQQQLFTSLSNEQLLSVWTTVLHQEVSQISLEITSLRTAYVLCSSLCDTFSSKREKNKAAAITWGMHEISNRWTVKLLKKFCDLKTTLTGSKEPKPQASKKRWQAPSSQQVGKHQEVQEEAGPGQ